MPDPIFSDSRLAQLYDDLEGAREDLVAYSALVDEFDVSSCLDVGCGTGSLACLLAERGVYVVGIDPAPASLDVARSKPGADQVRWIEGQVTAAPPLQVDMVTMTGNVAQVFLSDRDWSDALKSCRGCLRSGGLLVFEVRDPERKEWLEWTRSRTFETITSASGTTFDYWVELLDEDGPFVSFRQTFCFHVDGSEVISDSTLRFRSRGEIEESLTVTGLALRDVRAAPDRPGRELVFISGRVN